MMYAETLKICRLCFCESQSLINLFRRNGRASIEVKLISDLLRFEVSHNDGYPRFVCCTCLEKLTNFDNFKNDCINFKTIFDKNYAYLKESRCLLTQLETVNSVKQEIEEEIQVAVKSEDNVELLEDPLRLTTPFDNQDGLGIHEDLIEIKTHHENQDTTEIQEDPLNVTALCDNQNGMELHEDPLEMATPYDDQDNVDIPEDPLVVTAPYETQLECRILGISKQESEEVEETSGNEMRTVEVVDHEMEENIKETARSKMKNVKDTKLETVKPIKVTERSKVIENSKEKTEVKDDLKRTEAKDDSRTEPKDDLSEITKEKYKKEWSAMDTDDDDSQSDKDFTLEEEKNNVKSKSIKSPNLAYSASKSEIIPSDKEELENFKMSISKAVKIMQARVDKIMSIPENVTRRTSFPCDECDKTFHKIRLLTEHKKKDHGRIVPFPCHICSKAYDRLYCFTRHMKSHPKAVIYKPREAVPIDQQRMIIRKKWFQCDKCTKLFKNCKLLDEHMGKHEKGSPYTCLVCGKKFTRLLSWREHFVFHGKKQLGCSKCSKRFYNSYELRVHLRRHSGEKPYQCKICQKSFVVKTALNYHMITHEDKVPYECDVCHMTFSLKHQVAKHMLLHTNPKKLTCEQCGKLCSSIYTLKIHKESHSSTPEYLCNLCGKTFTSNGNLKQHMKVHNGKLYTCGICDKAFNRKSNLLLHQSVHSESKAFMCEKCGKCFSRMVHLKYHKRIHERDNELV